MITIFNRSELIVTCSMERFSKVGQALEANGIDYSYRFRDLGVPPPGATLGRFGRGTATIEYKVYVRRKDYDRAKHVTGL